MSFARLKAGYNLSRRVNSGVRHAWMLRHEASRKESARARAATRRRSNKRLHPTGICLSLIEKMSHDVVVSRRVNRGVRWLLLVHCRKNTHGVKSSCLCKEIKMRDRFRYIVLACALLIIALFSIYIWATRYRYDTAPLYNKPTRVDRLTDDLQVYRSGVGWVSAKVFIPSTTNTSDNFNR
jgi:hypothetical protein